MLEFHLGDIIFQLVVVIILMLIVSKFAVGPVVRMMRDRQTHIDDQLKAAENSQKEAEAILAKQQEELKKVREQANQMLETEKKRAEAEGQELLNQAKARADRIVEDAKEEIRTEKEKAVASLRDEVAHLSMLLASKVLEREVSEKEHKQEIDAFVKQIGERL
ncbi:F-type H+-transporting ATPase subunit b [Pullulanibacillus pueri]|uniref:ATP synthase subunit b n=1 Tax=Pullulanibacillus pueri TaxID=1437324 RepID=A0A8J2ZXF3_9BACL|nr:F0F1 ATP synthase subunit B [Pullulanibacillus pueri]MBM7681732.1 F-type H+-transporting ATPase subunit b [Pullulanibacillus pueri]GGH84080.1 hypothetical protein GCM10007096_26330 [Pullulanibacillus pueri]